MARLARSFRVVLGGVLPNGEIFQTGFWCRPGDTDPSVEAQQLMVQAVADDFAGAAGTVMRSLIAPPGGFTYVRLYWYPTVEPAAANVSEAAMNLPGTGSTTSLLPLQTSIVTTYKTGGAGRRRTGRGYWPLTSASLTNHQLTQAKITDIAGAVAGFLAAVEANPTHELLPIVMSSVGSFSNPITRVTVDSEPDIQRRRANRQTELFQAEAVV